MTTDEVTAAANRWALADERARAVLAAAEPSSRPRAAAPVLWVLVASAAVAVALVVLAVVLPSGAPGRSVTTTVVMVAALAGMVVQVVASIVVRRRRGVPPAPVVALLQTRERHAVRQAFHGSRPVPEDRRRVVDAAATQAAAGQELVVLCLFAVSSVAGLTTGSELWPMFAAAGLLAAGSTVVSARDAVAARRWLADRVIEAPSPTT
jgi:hypothetical protein